MVVADWHDAAAVAVPKGLAILASLLCLYLVLSRCFQICKAAQRRALDRDDRDDPCYRLHKRIRYKPLSTVHLPA
jgi:hypothetical protein